ncbi:FecR family protein [Cyclobacterium qasimii]|uniref:Anti-sigma factor n=2 Tax=Cyclobacterium qasimii TaxID=1350429 RepID=A0A512C5V8_9BACT|nr:FecR family protein [Cyclobacterium qasimii]EPR65566.1 putative anti-sigma factor [Cyclobacterium qasimii M12-11B]GEO19581.1 hypothetical protein CQA01_01150 [Cyclobacterium qasimii]
MNNFNETVKELILNPEFREWVLKPNPDADRIWKNYLFENPTLSKGVDQAKEILIELFSDRYPLQSSEFKEMWDNINTQSSLADLNPLEGSNIPENSSLAEDNSKNKNRHLTLSIQFLFKIAAILLVSIGVGFILFKTILVDKATDPLNAISYKTYQTPPGVKSSIKLHDGTKVLLNAGSILKYKENPSENRREVYLKGEAFFDVHPDPEKPFTVTTREISTTAIGTTFNIKAYEEEDLIISLITGKVAVGTPMIGRDSIFLNEREILSIPLKEGAINRIEFDDDEVLGWTRKMIVFDNTSLPEAIRTLENWYGVSFKFENEPGPDLYISGKFQNETLKNVMDGLMHTMQLEYTIAGEIVKVTF